MRKPRFSGRLRLPAGFTLIELLTVIAVIAILTALTLYAARTVMSAGQRNRTTTEIQGISTNLENYKTDNGSYPLSQESGSPLFASAAAYGTSDGTGTTYQESSELLFQALTGKYNLLDPTLTAGSKSYMTFKTSQVGNKGASAGTTTPGSTTYVQDPYGYSYGYSTGDGTANNPPNTGLGNFDLWSTGGTTMSTTNYSGAQAWITNWNR